jgi:hypothetical protein
MAETAATIQAKILVRTGDVDATTGDPVLGGGGYLSTLIAGIWGEYADKAYVAPRLQELYTERDLFDRMITLIQDRFDFSDSDASFKRSQRVQTLVDRRDVVQGKIDALLAMVAANRAPAVGAITATAPMGPPFPLGVNANHPQYGGSPYFRRPWGYP